MIKGNKLASILLIDDDNVTNLINSKLLKTLDISDHIIFKDQAQDALNYLKELIDKGLDCPELIILDINMPVIDGECFLEKFNTLPFKNKDAVKVVILSDSTHPINKLIFYDLDVKYYINKPLSKEKILNILR